ncbi:molecular chaperone HtpG [Candidatus Neptunochlamydia vexilliferae]|uniref:Chaperone protein htpG n=1 Tax=Candidatus Neptunichlamydia vexilliferae TaxID=1651774 RepID=A0ABS0AXW7_9BACT|nr:molecular chaperone HtpG [Candidatus Neptunochlamydia vexilliferae]MBF5058976.1 Chaperone protein htpG [Candidatus Neptunochlamydia vexilliferae]
MSQGTLKIHSENILPIIKKWLYTDRDIFLRELISNACDAMSKLKILRDQGKADFKDEELRIDITLDTEKKTLQISDTGLGMTGKEVEKYIAQLAFSGAEEFVKKYQDKGADEIIGHFGLGFYSSFMVSDTVEIDTHSYQKNTKAALWSCDGSPNYTLDAGTREERGTTITLHINKESEEFLEEARIREMLLKHCRFLPYPIHLNGTHINDKEPLWTKPASECTDKEYIDFYHTLYPLEPDPIFWIHLNVDYPFHLQGILYFPKIGKRIDPNQPTLQLYCNRVFVSDNCKDLIPDFLTVLRGVIDSPDIPLNVSRSNLQMDRTVRQLASHISKKVSDKLTAELQSNRESFIEKWPDIEMVLKLGILQDDKFYDRVKNCLIWKTSEETWTTLDEYMERHPEKKIYYHHDEKQVTHFFDMYKEKGIEILFAPSHLDTPLMTFLEGKHTGATFQRLDGAIDELILDKDKEKTVLDSDGKTEAVKIADYFRTKLPQEGLEVEAKSLSSSTVPAFIMLSEKERRMRDYFALSGQALPNIGNKQTFVINTNSPLIQSLPKLETKNPDLATSLVKQLYELSLLSQRELPAEDFSPFLKRSSELLEELATALAT